jgi:hypothetical protein
MVEKSAWSYGYVCNVLDVIVAVTSSCYSTILYLELKGKSTVEGIDHSLGSSIVV